MDKNQNSYWEGTEPKSTKELNLQIKKAVQAIRAWKDAADELSAENSVMMEAQIYWLEELLKLAHVELNKPK